MVIDFVGPERSDDPMVDRYVPDGEQIRDPILIKGQKDEHDEKMKMKLDVAAGKVHEDSG
jgi:hypothetical protein